MDTREKNKNTESGGARPGKPNQAEGTPAEGGKPRYAGNRQNGNRGGKPRGGNRPAQIRGEAPQSRPQTEEAKPDNRPQQNKNPRGNQNRDQREPRKPETEAAVAAEGQSERSRHPSTGRPQRNIRKVAQREELPDMNDLLIEDSMNTAEGIHPVEDAADAAEVERILERDIFARSKETLPEVIPEGKVVVAGIRFRTGGKTYFFAPGALTCEVGKHAIVETARGLEFGEIYIGNRMVDESLVVQPLRPVVRIATEEDIAHNAENCEREVSAYKIGMEKIAEHKLDMKLVSVQYTFDNSKLLFYFTSAGRVDFRELVKDLAGVFHIRIELRQIGIRDEARMIGGLGACGRPLCCTTFLSDFGQVSMKMAKEQNLSLNSTKISGCCGRLMCCLRYEYDTYAEEIRKTPSQGTFVNTPDGPGVVTEIFPLQGEVKVSLRNQSDSAPKRYKREQVEIQTRTPRPEPSAEDTVPTVEPEAEADE